nr:hypothetical protein [Tanacetum cinerariifolium]
MDASYVLCSVYFRVFMRELFEGSKRSLSGSVLEARIGRVFKHGSVWMHPRVYSCIMFRHLSKLVGILLLFLILIHLIRISYDIRLAERDVTKVASEPRLRPVEPRLRPVEPSLRPVEPRWMAVSIRRTSFMKLCSSSQALRMFIEQSHDEVRGYLKGGCGNGG